MAEPMQPPMVTGRVQLKIAGETVELEVTAPSGPSTLEALLPVFQALSDKAVALGVERAERQGERVSCRKGCAACCRQAVPLSEPEAHAVARLVEDLPEPRRSQVRARFADVLRQLETRGLLDKEHAARRDGDFRAFGVDYLLSGIACPLLEAESCSIHPHRPLACREYLVSSPPEVCAYPVRERLKPVPPVGQPSLALREVGRDQTPGGWVLLAEALEWAHAHPAPAPERTGPELIEAVFARYATEG